MQSFKNFFNSPSNPPQQQDKLDDQYYQGRKKTHNTIFTTAVRMQNIMYNSKIDDNNYQYYEYNGLKYYFKDKNNNPVPINIKSPFFTSFFTSLSFINYIQNTIEFHDKIKKNKYKYTIAAHDTIMEQRDILENSSPSLNDSDESPYLLDNSSGHLKDIPRKLYDAVLDGVKKEESEAEAKAKAKAESEAKAGGVSGGKQKSKGKTKKVDKNSVVSLKKKSIYKEILGKQMKIYKMPDSHKEHIKYKGELIPVSDYKKLFKNRLG